MELDQRLRVLLLQELHALLQVQHPLLSLVEPERRAVLPGLGDRRQALAQARRAPVHTNLGIIFLEILILVLKKLIYCQKRH